MKEGTTSCLSAVPSLRNDHHRGDSSSRHYKERSGNSSRHYSYHGSRKYDHKGGYVDSKRNSKDNEDQEDAPSRSGSNVNMSDIGSKSCKLPHMAIN